MSYLAFLVFYKKKSTISCDQDWVIHKSQPSSFEEDGQKEFGPSSHSILLDLKINNIDIHNFIKSFNYFQVLYNCELPVSDLNSLVF